MAKYKGYRVASSIQKAVRLICKAAGIKKTVSAHTMRRTFNNEMRRLKVDQIAIRAMMGHSTEEMTSHYSFVDLEEKRSHVLKLVQELK